MVSTLGPGRHGDGAGPYLVVDPTPAQARRWVVRVTIKGRRNAKGGPLRTDFGLGSAMLVSLNEARDRALVYRRLAHQGIDSTGASDRMVLTFEDVARQVHLERMPT
ncbi:MAG: Arm DNA-binding domain-containing protein [Paracoccaceae bacterium]